MLHLILQRRVIISDKDENNNHDKDTKEPPQKHKRADSNTTISSSTNNNSNTNSSINNNNQQNKATLLQNEKRNKKTQKVQESMDYFRIQPLRFTRFINVPIMCRRHHDNNTNNDNTAPSLKSTNSIGKHDITTYIFRTPSISRRFVLEKAKALGVPPGPLYAR